MVDLGPFPSGHITNDQNDFVIADVIDVELSEEEQTKLFKLLDLVEGVDSGMYEHVTIEIDGEEAHIYECKMDTEGCPVVHDWKNR